MSFKKFSAHPTLKIFILLSVFMTLPLSPLAATIQGTIFNDLNGNGTKESCEPIQAGIDISIRDNAKSDAGLGGFFNTKSDAKGYYSSTGHTPGKLNPWGSFTLWAAIPNGQIQTTPVKGEGMVPYDFNIGSTTTIDIGFANKNLASNKAPTVTVADSKITVVQGRVVNLAATFADSENDAMCGVKWDFGDGTSADTLNASHTYTQCGTYTATVTVTDVQGGTGTATVTVIVQSPPIVNAGTDTAAEVGQLVNFNGTFTDPDGSSPYKYLWKFGDGNTKSGSVSKIKELSTDYAYPQDGVFTAILEVTDKEGNTGTDSLVVNIRGINTDACATGVATIKSNFSFGMWNNPNVWDTKKVPGPSDWVLIQGGHTIILPDSISSSSTQLQIKGLCIAPNGVLQSAFNSLTSASSWINIFAANIHNQGAILSSPGVNGSPLGGTYENATSASHVKFFASKFINDTTGLIATNARGGDDIPYLYLAHQTGINAQGGDGGRIEIYPSVMINSGKIQGGRGGDAIGFRWQPFYDW